MGAMKRMRQRLARWWRAQEAVPGGDRDSWAGRQVRRNAERIEAQQAQINDLKAVVAALAEGVSRVHAVAGHPLPDEITAGAETQPILRAI